LIQLAYQVAVWLSGNAQVAIKQVTYSASVPVSTWMGDRLWAG